MNSETITSGDERIGRYLKALKPHYANSSTKHGLKRLPGEQQPDGSWRFPCLDAELGRFTILLGGLRYVDGYGSFEREDPARHLLHPWSLAEGEEGWTLDLHHKNFMGFSSGRYQFTSLAVEQEHRESEPGACKACGSKRMKVRLPLYFEIEMNGEKAASWDGNGSIGNHLTQAHCAACGTEQPQFGFIGFEQLTINGTTIDRETREGDVTLAALLGAERTEI